MLLKARAGAKTEE